MTKVLTEKSAQLNYLLSPMIRIVSLIVDRSRFIKNALDTARTLIVNDNSTFDRDVESAKSDEADCKPEKDDDEIAWDDFSAAAEGESGKDKISEEESTKGDSSDCTSENDTGVLTLPDEDPEVFATYIQLLYTDTLPIFEHPEKEIRDASPDEIDQAEKDFKIATSRSIHKKHKMLGHLYVLAEKLEDVVAKCSVMSAMVESTQTRRADGHRYFPVGRAVKNIYAGTKSLDPMRKFLTDVAVLWWHAGWGENTTTEHYYPEYMFDVVVGMGKARGYPRDEALMKSTESATIYRTELRNLAKR